MTTKIFTHFDPPKRRQLSGFEPDITEQAYIPVKKQVEAFMIAGERLQASRRNAFDYPEDFNHENGGDVSGEPVYDRASAAQAVVELRARLAQAEADLAAKKAADEAAAKAAQSPVSGSQGAAKSDDGAPK